MLPPIGVEGSSDREVRVGSGGESVDCEVCGSVVAETVSDSRGLLRVRVKLPAWGKARQVLRSKKGMNDFMVVDVFANFV